MTIEEAINVLRNTAWLGTEKDREKVEKALETLSNHSEVPNSSDPISRHGAITAIIGLPTWYYDSDRHYGDPQPPMEALLDPEDVVNAIENLPPAQPEIIYCKDCKWKQGSECVMFADVRPFPNDFCSRAEGRTDG